MKSATKTISIIWGVLSAIVALVLTIVASMCVVTKDDAVARLVAGGMSEADAIASSNALIVTMFIFAFIALCSTIYSFILAILVYKENLSRVARNVLGAAAIVLLDVLPGILFLIDANLKPKDEATVKEE